MDTPFPKKIITFLLYFLPVAFFVVCYFLIITSGEDIWQGANTSPNILGDALAAFNHSVRLADMFAWAVINFFDYRYSFGPDTFLRILDVLAALSVLYFSTYLVLWRRPRFRLLDASVFCGIFLALNLTSNGLTLYAGFSKIHNYLFISFFSLIFGIIYLRDLFGREPLPWKLPAPLLCFLVFLLGFIFGFSSNVTAIVFLLTLPVYLALSRPKHFVLSWRFWGVLGIFLSLFVMYGLGSGLGDYDTNPVYRSVFDYLPLSELFSAPVSGLIRIVKHNLYNFARFIFPFFVASVPIFLYLLLRLKSSFLRSLKNLPSLFSNREQHFLLASLIFIFLHILALSQIYYPTRLVLPAYLLAVSVFFFVLLRLFSTLKAPLKNSLLLPSVFVILAVGVLSVRTFFALSYLKKISPVLDEIKSSDSSTLCVSQETAKANSLPYIHLAQEDFLVDWAMPQTIYEKTITYCE